MIVDHDGSVALFIVRPNYDRGIYSVEGLMAQVSKAARTITLGIIAVMSVSLFIVSLRDYDFNGAKFTACTYGCHTNVEALAFFGAIGLLTTLAFLVSILGDRQ